MKLNNKGFTLIEVLIAITLLSFVVIGITTATNNAIDTKERVTKEDDRLLQIDTALGRMEWDFSHAYTPLYFSIPMSEENLETEELLAVFQKTKRTIKENPRAQDMSYEGLIIPKLFASEKDKLSFFTIGNRRRFINQKQSHFNWIRYQLEETSFDEEDDQQKKWGKSLTRSVIADSPFNSSDLDFDEVKSQTLLKNVESLKFEYWDYKARKWKDSLSSVEYNKNMLVAVKVIIKWMETSEDSVIIEKIFRPLFPIFKSEDFYELETIKDDEFLNAGEMLDDFDSA